MRKITLSAAVVLGLSATAFSQSYYEASGQTAVFTLKAGARTNPVVAVKSKASTIKPAMSALSVAVNKTTITLVLGSGAIKTADLAFYDVAGKLVYRQSASSSVVHIDVKKFGSGVFAAVVKVDGVMMTKRFAVGR